MYLLEETRHKEKFLDFFLFSILLFSGLIEGVIVMSIVSYLSVQGMLVFLDCKHALLSRKKLHSDHEGIIIISLPKRFLWIYLEILVDTQKVEVYFETIASASTKVKNSIEYCFCYFSFYVNDNVNLKMCIRHGYFCTKYFISEYSSSGLMRTVKLFT